MKKEIPAISVVLPTYNQASFLPIALESIFNQTWQDFELIVVNDGSTDDTPQILNKYQRRYNFVVIHQENKKLPRALNTGFRRARARLLTWTSSDNVMLPSMLEVLIDEISKHPEIGLVYADWEEIDEDGTIMETKETLDYDKYLLMRVNFINACFLYRRECQKKVGLYNPDYLHAEDWEYWYRISRYFDMLRIPKVLYQYRIHKASLTQKKVLTKEEGLSVGYRKLENEFRSRRWSWYFSKLKWEWLRLRIRGNLVS